VVLAVALVLTLAEILAVQELLGKEMLAVITALGSAVLVAVVLVRLGGRLALMLVLVAMVLLGQMAPHTLEAGAVALSQVFLVLLALVAVVAEVLALKVEME
jgi:hypothetical protein